MNISHIRTARLGEVPTHYANEDIAKGEPLIDIELRAEQARQEELANLFVAMFAHPPRFRIRHNAGKEIGEKFHRDFADAIAYSLEVKKAAAREKRSDRAWMWWSLGIGVPFVLFCGYRLGEAIAIYYGL